MFEAVRMCVCMRAFFSEKGMNYVSYSPLKKLSLFLKNSFNLQSTPGHFLCITHALLALSPFPCSCTSKKHRFPPLGLSPRPCLCVTSKSRRKKDLEQTSMFFLTWNFCIHISQCEQPKI